MKTETTESLITDVEIYIRQYVALPDSLQSLPLALWTVGTFCFESFDAFPYLTITSSTKRSGKTRLSEILGFMSHEPCNISAVTGATLFRLIELNKPTLICDEAETLNSESAGVMRSVLNVGYRRGQKIPRTQGTGIKEFDTYCPKIFVLIGDTYDTLRDRSIIFNLSRGIPAKRFVWNIAEDEGRVLRRAIERTVKAHAGVLEASYVQFPGLPFLMGRDEEIWTSLFAIATVFCPSRLAELRSIAADLSTEKTAEARRYIQLEKQSSADVDSEYSERLLKDLHAVMLASGRHIATQDAVTSLKAIPEAPWRKFRGMGIDARQMGHMLSRFGVTPKSVRIGSGRANSRVLMGYRFQDVQKALQGL